MQRRQFLGTIAVGAGGLATAGCATTGPVSTRRGAVRTPDVELLYMSPDTYPNALEAADDGLWLGDQVSERVHKLDWETGEVLYEVLTESHNMSGLGFGRGFLWIGANGAGTAAERREARPSDRPFSEILQIDVNTGKTVRAVRPPWAGGIHGVTYVEETNRLWVVAPGLGFFEMDPWNDYRIHNMIRESAAVPHGIAYHDGSVWVMSAADRVAERFDPSTGQVIETWVLTSAHPDPHGMCIHNGYMYFTDAGLGGGRTPSPSSAPRWIVRFPLS